MDMLHFCLKISVVWRKKEQIYFTHLFAPPKFLNYRDVNRLNLMGYNRLLLFLTSIDEKSLTI